MGLWSHEARSMKHKRVCATRTVSLVVNSMHAYIHTYMHTQNMELIRQHDAVPARLFLLLLSLFLSVPLVSPRDPDEKGRED